MQVRINDDNSTGLVKLKLLRKKKRGVEHSYAQLADELLWHAVRKAIVNEIKPKTEDAVKRSHHA